MTLLAHVQMAGRSVLSAVVLSAAAVIAATACARSPVRRAVSVRGFVFAPTVDTILLGDTVVWTNRDPVPHTATARGRAFDTGAILAGGSARVVVATAGTFVYECIFHPTMQATLVVR